MPDLPSACATKRVTDGLFMPILLAEFNKLADWRRTIDKYAAAGYGPRAESIRKDVQAYEDTLREAYAEYCETGRTSFSGMRQAQQGIVQRLQDFDLAGPQMFDTNSAPPQRRHTYDFTG